MITGIGNSVQGHNLYSYCFNNPVNMDDSMGNWPKWIKNSVKWVAKNVVKPVVKTVQKTLSKVDPTYSSGVNISGTPSFWSFNGQVGLSLDTKGNVAIQGAVIGGTTIGTPCMSVTKYSSVTNAPSIRKLNGMGYQLGGSAIIPVDGVPVAIGGDFNIIPDDTSGKTYFGTTKNIGVGVGQLGVEFHVEWGNTGTWKATQFNVFDMARQAYIKVMEW